MKRTNLATVAAMGLLLCGGPWLVLGQNGGGGMGGMGPGGMGAAGMVPGGMGGEGGMGMGMGGGMGNAYPGLVARDKMLDEMTKKPRSWAKPKGPAPSWLQSGRTSLESMERIRSTLCKPGAFAFQGMPLTEVLTRIREELDIPIFLNDRALVDSNIAPDEQVTLQTNGSYRNVMRLILNPLDLTYVVREGYIEVTTVEAAKSNPSLGFYDLSFVVSDTGNLKAIVNAIEQSVEPMEWLESGGESRILVVDNLLIVSASEKAHIGVEALLARLAPIEEVEPGKEKPLVKNDSAGRPSIPFGNPGTPVLPGTGLPPEPSPSRATGPSPLPGKPKPVDDDPFR